MIITLEDLLIGSRTIWMEARNQSYLGQKAVAHVILNRVNYRTDDRWTTIAQVCLDWLQFSGWREQDPNFVIGLKADVSLSLFRTALRALLEALDEEDFTEGARHYYAKYLDAAGKTPKWAIGKTPCFEEGDHKFFNDIN